MLPRWLTASRSLKYKWSSPPLASEREHLFVLVFDWWNFERLMSLVWTDSSSGVCEYLHSAATSLFPLLPNAAFAHRKYIFVWTRACTLHWALKGMRVGLPKQRWAKKLVQSAWCGLFALRARKPPWGSWELPWLFSVDKSQTFRFFLECKPRPRVPNSCMHCILNWCREIKQKQRKRKKCQWSGLKNCDNLKKSALKPVFYCGVIKNLN